MGEEIVVEKVTNVFVISSFSTRSQELVRRWPSNPFVNNRRLAIFVKGNQNAFGRFSYHRAMFMKKADNPRQKAIF